MMRKKAKNCEWNDESQRIFGYNLLITHGQSRKVQTERGHYFWEFEFRVILRLKIQISALKTQRNQIFEISLQIMN